MEATMKMKLILFMLLIVWQSNAQDVAINRKKEFNLKNSVAIQGYDPVAYFASGKALAGKKEFSFSYQGVTYHFSSITNRDLFKATPEKYEPVYGGWCAYAMGATGEKVEVDPETFKIIDGKLYLYYNKFFTNTLKTWNKDEKSLKEKADINWMKFFKN
jgi:YHS domain-containing protein